LGCAALATFTSHKLFVMAKLRGDIGDLPQRELVVDGRLRGFPDGSGVYALYDPARREASKLEIQFTSAQAERYRPHARIVVRCEETGRACYMPDSVYIDDGNRSFDLGLLVIELSGLTACLVALGRRRAAWHAALRGIEIRKRS
jgi:hypothetical protein